MAKIVKLDPIDEETAIKTNDNLLSGLLRNELNVLQECGGRGMCSTCHIYIKEGMGSLSPLNRREKRTLEVITTCKMNSRLACQARVIGEGVVIELPSGMYLSEIEDIDALIGRRAQQDILHPLSGKVLVEEGKLISRSMISQLKDTRGEIKEYLAKTEDYSY
ncbi:MAG: 2Fe-2S iron-sulfur cluster binding domain-containing protein [Gomphosphaeria aponina SAG 52.96 = DSM 107014]|uniref:2Fe-2S iron-sulfur cluster binding domain-containing protein n=1 Tax=Gomphosphaeria aponina SAG 52.96 = DSM 107014 TaxID=1521640 RepID=A0A941GRQ6_9CHRO|nr:2Fe-2S iron-sulfur cluster binding domain-containing protein [Gomphosphaeria aponina SAG 52.96 = DSM 107014]